MPLCEKCIEFQCLGHWNVITCIFHLSLFVHIVVSVSHSSPKRRELSASFSTELENRWLGWNWSDFRWWANNGGKSLHNPWKVSQKRTRIGQPSHSFFSRCYQRMTSGSLGYNPHPDTYNTRPDAQTRASLSLELVINTNHSWNQNTTRRMEGHYAPANVVQCFSTTTKMTKNSTCGMLLVLKLDEPFCRSLFDSLDSDSWRMPVLFNELVSTKECWGWKCPDNTKSSKVHLHEIANELPNQAVPSGIFRQHFRSLQSFAWLFPRIRRENWRIAYEMDARD